MKREVAIVNEEVNNEEFLTLVDELILIGYEIEDPTHQSSGYLRKRETAEASRHPGARAIGIRLNEIGGSPMMSAASRRVEQEHGPIAAQELAWCWHGVGSWLA